MAKVKTKEKMVRKFRGMGKRALENWWIACIIAVICAALGVVYSMEMRPVRYEADFTLFINADETVKNPAYAADMYAQLAASETFCKTALRNSGIENGTAGELQSTLCVRTCGQKVTVSLTASDYAEAERIANAMIAAITEQGKALVLGTEATVLYPVEVDTSYRGYICFGLVGLLVGIVIGVIAAFLFAELGDSLGSFTWLKQTYPDVPVLCVVHPVDGGEKPAKKKKAEEEDEEDDKPLKEFRATDLATLSRVLPFCFPEHEGSLVLGVVGFSDPLENSHVTVDIARTLAQTGHKVVLVDGDMRDGMVAKILHRSAAPGLSDLIIGSSSNVLRRGILHENLTVVTRGTTPPDETVLLKSGIYGRILETLSAESDYVIVNLPALGEKTVLTGIDGVLPVINHSDGKRSAIICGLNLLAEKNAYVPGFVEVENHPGF